MEIGASPHGIADDATAPMLFCSTCSNLLYPQSDDERKMLWYCSNCNKTDEFLGSNLVYVLNLKLKSGGTEGETKLLAEFASDPTAQRDPTQHCKRCMMSGVACFVNPLGQPQEDMTLYFACSNPTCRHVWKGEQADEA